MDPINLISTALVHGAAKTTTEVVPDSYKGLRELRHNWFTIKSSRLSRRLKGSCKVAQKSRR
ncbi:hypothetical protein [Synechococcus sp. BA-132 BA5]|jgi:hypothetical protein|uniref:hypothetical protein n=1 Tax=Synechococcus sp. BA-132 BA5 TaxID=3110252 RepID=UPI002B2079B8|nr:hypothetical protein [Synechococcus sp. BA-132 BA5]